MSELENDEPFEKEISNANQDIFFAFCFLGLAIHASNLNWNESDWLGLFGTIIWALICVLWIVARTYHVLHPEEVFGNEEPAPNAPETANRQEETGKPHS